MPINSEVGGLNSNSYVSLAEADAYFADSLKADEWALLTNKEQALISATSYLDGLDYVSYASNDDQALEWPRNSFNGIPSKLKVATFELALYMAENIDSFGIENNTTEIKVGPIAIKKQFRAIGSFSSLPQGIKNLLRRYLSDSSCGFRLELS